MDTIRDREIRRRRQAGESYGSIARDYDLSRQQVCNICKDTTPAAGSKEDTELYRFLVEENAFICSNGKRSNVPLMAYNLVWRAWAVEHDGYPTMEYFRILPVQDLSRMPKAGRTVCGFIESAKDRLR